MSLKLNPVTGRLDLVNPSGISTTLTNTHILVGNSSNVATDVALSGDATLSNTGALTLATVATAGTTGSSTAIPVITINAKGLVTSITTAAVVAPAGTLTGTTLASNVVTSSLTAVGTITTGVWNGTAIANANLANSTISGVALGGTLAALTATDTTLTFSGSYTGATARTVGINLSTANTWTGAITMGTTTKILFTDASAFINASSSGNLVVQGATTTTLGVASDMIGGDGTLRVWYPQTDKKLDLGKATNRWNQLFLGSTIGHYNSVATTTWGVPAIYGTDARVTGQVNSRSALVSGYTVGAADGTFEVSGNVNVTVSTTHSFSLDVIYTDETNTNRTLILPVVQLGGTFVVGGLITAVTGVGPYESAVVHIRAKASTTITIRPSATGTYTAVTYNVEGKIKQTG